LVKVEEDSGSHHGQQMNYFNQTGEIQYRWSCSWCNKVFFNAVILKNHEELQHIGYNLTHWCCSWCDHEFSTEKELAKHETIHMKRLKERAF
jgi:hypothetical protein